MKPRSAKDFRSLSQKELEQMIGENQDNISRQRFQLSLKQLHDVASIKVLRQDIARMQTVLNEKLAGK